MSDRNERRGRQATGSQDWLGRPIAPSEQRRIRLATLAVVTAVAAGFFAASFASFRSSVHDFRNLLRSGPSWSFPARLYTAGVTIVPGPDLPRTYLLRELAARGYRPAPKPPAAPGRFVAGTRDVEIGLRGFDAVPDPEGTGGPERVRVEFDHERALRVERLGGYAGLPPPDSLHAPRLEPVPFSELLDDERVRRTWVPLARIPRVVQDAVIASEDRRFRSHSGLDLRSNARALLANVRAGGVRQGGSTLTQQLARGLFLGRERTYGRKFTEAVFALGIERTLDKDQILEMYLNSIYWGQDGSDGIAGIAEAARHYFGMPVDSLTLGQAALLAGIIPGPNTLSPFRSPGAARRARDGVLRDLVAVGTIDRATAAREAARAITTRYTAPAPERFAAFATLVRDELSRRVTPDAAVHQGLCVFTTMDAVWQAEAESLLAAGVARLDPGARGQPRLEGACVVLDPFSGAVRAVVGGRNMGPQEFNRATHAKRQPGSAIKPVVYAAALDPERPGPRFMPATTLPDLRREFATPEGPWKPRNDADDYHERVTLAKALAKSLNIATANLVEAIGARTVVRYAERFGLGRLRPVASIGLGSNEVTLLSLTSAYTVFSNRGQLAEPTTIRAIITARGSARGAHPTRLARVIPPETAALMTGLLEDVVIFGVSYPLRKTYGFARPVAGKTGTTNDYRDAWFIGFTPQVVAGVWVGYDQPMSLGAPAAEVALPVWAGIMTPLLRGFPALEFGSDKTLDLAWIDPYTGDLARSDCPSTMRVPFARGTAPRRMCARDHTADWERIRAEALADSLAADSAHVAPPDTTGSGEPE